MIQQNGEKVIVSSLITVIEKLTVTLNTVLEVKQTMATLLLKTEAGFTKIAEELAALKKADPIQDKELEELYAKLDGAAKVLDSIKQKGN